MIDKDFNSLIELLEAFPDEQSCIDHLTVWRWKGNVVSPFDPTSTVYKCKGNNYRCRNTGKYFNARTYTLFDNSKVPLRKWFCAIWLTVCNKKGVASTYLAKQLDVTQKTAWFILQRIRKCFGLSDNEPMLENDVELDETFVGGKNKNRHHDKKVPMSKGRAHVDKTPVLGMVERGGRVRAFVVPDTSSRSLTPLILANVERTATLYTDEWYGYYEVSRIYPHDYVDHSTKQYAKGDVTTNTIEGFWSILKRGIIGIYHKVSRKHLQKYVDEFAFRYNTRGLSDRLRFNCFLCGMERRLTYNTLVHG